MKHRMLLLTLVAFCLSACSIPLEKQIQGTYRCEATGDRMIFKKNGSYLYSLGGEKGPWTTGFYSYDDPPLHPIDPPPNFSLSPTPPPAIPYNTKGQGLRLNSYLSTQSGIWELPYFESPSKRILTLQIGGAGHGRGPMYKPGISRTYIKQD